MLERRRRDEGLVRGELVGRVDDQEQEGERRGDRHHVEEGPRRRRQHADKRRHAHVLAAPEGDDRAQHRQPQEQDRGQFVRPDERLVEARSG